jgi:hypothetical protein
LNEILEELGLARIPAGGLGDQQSKIRANNIRNCVKRLVLDKGGKVDDALRDELLLKLTDMSQTNNLKEWGKWHKKLEGITHETSAVTITAIG